MSFKQRRETATALCVIFVDMILKLKFNKFIYLVRSFLVNNYSTRKAKLKVVFFLFRFCMQVQRCTTVHKSTLFLTHLILSLCSINLKGCFGGAKIWKVKVLYSTLPDRNCWLEIRRQRKWVSLSFCFFVSFLLTSG
jgi:hypothetical protein